ncbi:major facilitator superfamily domain-containing protein [Nemania abortiva]|nr:major facilitator superfamily domain-containing protein [Nemania abortiva]
MAHAEEQGLPATFPDGSPDVSSLQLKFKGGFRVWAIIVGLGITNVLAALENTVVSVAAPAIYTDLKIGVDYVWVTNAFFLASTVICPLFGQFCNIFGRKYVIFLALAAFVLGSGICGGAKTGGQLIAGRTIQGVGSGGIIMTTSIIISDLVPLRDRTQYSALLVSIFGVAVALGPFIGGAIVSSTTWRWVFYLNLPIGGAAFVVLFIFLNVRYDKTTDLWAKLRRIDVLGNVVLIAGTVAILYAIAYAGTQYAWSSWHTLVPLILGFVGLGVFAALQYANVAREPVIPSRLFSSRTSCLVAISTFINAALLYWMIFFLPVYFQAVKRYEPEYTGVVLLPIALLGIPGSVVAALALARWGRYRVLHVVGFSIQAIGIGLFSLLWEETTVADFIVFESIAALGGGFVFDTLLPAFQTPVAEADQGAATAAWYFLRLFGHIWGVAIPSAILNSKVNALLAAGAVSDPLARAQLAGGGAYQAASAAFVTQFTPDIQAEISALYRKSLQPVWYAAAALSAFAALLSTLEKELEMRKTLETEFGLVDDKK